ncbi:MAG: hypothetical protein WCI74_20560 [Actinomycetes bacterium]
MNPPATNRDVDLVATCVGASDIPITIHLGRELALTTWLFRKSKYWLAREPATVSFSEIELLLAARPFSADARKASVAALQDAVVDLAWVLNSSPDDVVKATAALLATGDPWDAQGLVAITAEVPSAR